MSGLAIALAILVGLSAIAYAVIDYEYPDDVEWIQTHLADPRVADASRVEEARKEGYSEGEIASYLMRTFSERRARYMRVLLVGAPALALVMVLVAWSMVVLRREGSS